MLILDEPTNDLDMETLDLLQEVIADYAGTVLIVSHDRDFLDRTVTMVVGLDGSGKADIVAGGYADWEARRTRKAAPITKAAPPAAEVRKTATKLTFKEQRELDMLPGELDRLASDIAAGEALLADAGLYQRDRAKFDATNQALDTARARIVVAEERWLELAAKAEALAG